MLDADTPGSTAGLVRPVACYTDGTERCCTAQSNCNFTMKKAAEYLLVSRLLLNNKPKGSIRTDELLNF